jgi:hypothetical protein
MGRIEIRRAPPVVGQGSDSKCWAAAMESWLRAQVALTGPRQGKFTASTSETFGMPEDRHVLDGFGWIRKSATVQELLDTYSNIITSSGSLNRGEGLEQVAADSGMRWRYVDILNFNRDVLSPPMTSYGHLFIAYFAQSMYHANVGYGFTDQGVLVMDPRKNGSLTEITYDFLREMGRVNRPIFVGWPEKGDALTVDHAVERYLPDEWHVLIGGGWSGYFGFSSSSDGSTVYWRTFDQSVKHTGKWKREGMNITWQFSDDPSGWVRTFRIQINPDNTLADRIQGSATTPQGAASLFTMTRTDD